LAQSTNQIAFVSTTSVGSETAQIRESSQVALALSSTTSSQINTLTSPKISASKVENSSSFTSFFQTNQYYLVALGCLLSVTTCCVCYLYRRWRQKKRSATSQFTNSTMKPPSTKSHSSKLTTSGLFSTTSYSTSMSNTSSNQTSEFSQNQTISLTLASKELGNFVTFFILYHFVLTK
jgi:hypothetical protein